MAAADTLNEITGIFTDAITDTIAWIFLVAVATAVVFGVISWHLLKKFRTFRNYVLLSALIAELLLCLVLWISGRFISDNLVESNTAVPRIMLCVYVFFQSTFQYWLLVLCFVFSVDFVQVFHYDVRKKYLWSYLFAWGVPFITVLLYAMVGSILLNMSVDESKDIFAIPIAMSLILIPVVFSLITFLAVICRLICGSSTNNFCDRFTIATLIFVFSNVILFTAVPEILEEDIFVVDVVGEILEHSVTIALIVFIIVLKSNWKLWRDYISNKSGPETGVMLSDQRAY